MPDRHNIATRANQKDLPAPVDATASDLGRVIGHLSTIASELNAPAPSEEMRLDQYLRTGEYARWLAAAADDLAQALTTRLAATQEGHAVA